MKENNEMIVECIECLDKYREQDCNETLEGKYVCGNCIGYYEGELKWKTQLKQFTQLLVSDLACLH